RSTRDWSSDVCSSDLLPIAADDSRRRSTLALASRAASLAWSASLPASRTWEPMPCADWVNLSAACEKVVAVPWASLVRPVRALRSEERRVGKGWRGGG